MTSTYMTPENIEELKNFIAQNSDIFGAADIYNIYSQNPFSLPGILSLILACLHDSERKPVVHKFVLVVPPSPDSDLAEEKIWEEVRGSARKIFQRDMEPSEKNWLKSSLEIVVAPDRQTTSVLELIKTLPERTVVIVLTSTIYRNSNVQPLIAEGAVSPLWQEDVWVPQLCAFVTEAIDIAKSNSLYVAFDTNQYTPAREPLRDQICSIDGCGVMGSGTEASPESLVVSRIGQWDTWIREGYVGKALHEIDELPESLDDNKPLLRIQVLYKAELHLEALQAIRQELKHAPELDSHMRVKMARIAQDASASNLAEEILAPAVQDIYNLEDMESALATAKDISSPELVEIITSRLIEFFPDSSALKQHRLRKLLSEQNYSDAAMMIKDESLEESQFYDQLGRFLSTDGVPNYHGLISSAEGNAALADSYRMACVNDALSRQLIYHAFELAKNLPCSTDQMKRGEKLLLSVLERIFLSSTAGGSLVVPQEEFKSAIISLIQRLATQPDNQELRCGLAQLLHPSISGSMGLALIASIVLDLASTPIKLTESIVLNEADMEWLLERKTFIESSFSWMESIAPIVIGRVTLPDNLLTEPADEIVSSITSLLQLLPMEDETDVKAHQQFLTLATMVTPHCSDPDYDLKLLRLFGSRLTASNRFQMARDLVEQTLLNSMESPRRRRLGWFSMADVYHRCQNHLESLLALACTFSSNPEVEEDQIWFEITAMARLFRDSGLFSLAMSAVQKGRELLRNVERLKPNKHRLDTLELQIRQIELTHNSVNKDNLEKLLKDVIKNAALVLEKNDMTAPVAMMLGQLIRLSREVGTEIPDEAGGILSELTKNAGDAQGNLVKMMSAEVPSASGLLSIVQGTTNTRYSDDVGFEMQNAVIAARRALSNGDYISDKHNTVLALELLSDLGVGLPDWDESPTPSSPPQSIEEVADTACQFSKEGVSVVQAGFDSNGHLVRISTVDGQLEIPVRESKEIFSEDRFISWMEDYPFLYGIIEDDPNLFYTTTSGLSFSELPDGPIVLAADVRFQSFPPNLLYVDNEFSGRTRPMAMTPSLSWLRAARETGMVGDGRFCSWISTAVGATESQTLPMIAERLEPTFISHNFLIDNGPILPARFSGASLVVVTAHGGVHPDGKYFQVVSDEGVLKVTARDMANALRNVGIVILFVCSGGRADKHPRSHTTLGLAKDILDRGCAAVVASPWPLDARVPSHWLPVFLDTWSQGETLMEASFRANREVDNRFSLDPARGLAMTVFGNPLLRNA